MLCCRQLVTELLLTVIRDCTGTAAPSIPYRIATEARVYCWISIMDHHCLVCILYCGRLNWFCNVWVCVGGRRFCNVWVGVCMCGFCNVWVL